MGSPTAAEIHAQFKAVGDFLDSLNSSGATLNTKLDTAEQALEGDYALGALAALRQSMVQTSAPLSAERIRAHFDPIFREYAKLYNLPEDSGEPLFERLRDYFMDTQITVKERSPTYATFSAGGGNVGVPGTNGGLRRLTKDAGGYNLEAIIVEAKRIECIADYRSGATQHEEIFEFRGAKPTTVHNFGRTGSPPPVQIAAVSAGTTQSYLSNPSFSQYSGATGAGNLTGLNDWTVTGTIANHEVSTTDVYRGFPGDTTPTKLIIKEDVTLTQLLSVRNAVFDRKTPYCIGVGLRRRSSCDGTFTLTHGAVSKALDVTTLTNDAWTRHWIDADEDSWPENFIGSSMAFSMQLASNTTGDLDVDDIIIAPMVWWAGTWWAIIGGATPYIIGDVYTGSDAISSDAKLNKLVSWGYGQSLPSASSPTITDP